MGNIFLMINELFRYLWQVNMIQNEEVGVIIKVAGKSLNCIHKRLT